MRSLNATEAAMPNERRPARRNRIRPQVQQCTLAQRKTEHAISSGLSIYWVKSGSPPEVSGIGRALTG